MKKLVVLSDIHTGHRFAVSPLTWELPDEGSYSANKVQKALFQAWSEVANEWKNPDILVINGEPIDGQQTKNLGVEVWTTDYIEQIKASISLVKMFNAKKIYVTRGSNYHVSVGGVSVEEVFGQMVGAERVDGSYVSPELILDVDGTSFNIAHHIASSASGWQYKSTPLAKEMMLLKLVEDGIDDDFVRELLKLKPNQPLPQYAQDAITDTGKKPKSDVVIRSHVHYFWAVQTPSHLGLITPAWQLQTWFMRQKSTASTIPDIGAVRFTINGKKDFYYEKKLFRMKSWKPTVVKA